MLHLGRATVTRSGSDGGVVGGEGRGPEWVEGKPGTCLTAPAPLENDEGEVDGGGDMNAAGSGAFRERALGGSEGTSAATDPTAHAGHRSKGSTQDDLGMEVAGKLSPLAPQPSSMGQGAVRWALGAVLCWSPGARFNGTTRR